MNTALLIMAAGIGSRFGQGIKQLAGVGPNGEIIMEFSIHDAIEAGFNKIVFVIRKEIEEDFLEIINKRVKKVCDEKGIKLEYVFQEMDAIPEGFSVPEGRGKPWGTGQAVLAAKDVINEPFMVINADDYYGKEAFRSIHDFIAENEDDGICCMAGFIIKNTLSDHGTVTRGVCKVSDDGYLTDIVETSDIEKTETGAKAGDQTFDENTNVSMNMWGFRPCLMDSLDKGFKEFFENIGNNPLKAEYLLPSHVGDLLKAGALKVKVLPTHDKWLGITYQEDKPLVIEGFKKMLADGVYSEDLFSDL